MSERLTYENNDSYYLKWGVDQELINLSPETRELIRAAIKKLAEYENREAEGLIRTASEEWQTLEKERDYWHEIARRYAVTNGELREHIFSLRNDFDIEAVIDLDDTSASYPLAILRGIRERLIEEQKPKKPSKGWIFNRFGQR